jgi:hypothetical protein
MDEGAGHLAVRQLDPISKRGERHVAQELGADLAAESARAPMDCNRRFASRSQ